MGRTDHSSGFIARIGLLLVLLASLLVVNVDAGNAVERFAPVGVSSIDLDPNDDGYDPHQDGLDRVNSFRVDPFRRLTFSPQATPASQLCKAQWSCHFLVRGPPSAIA